MHLTATSKNHYVAHLLFLTRNHCKEGLLLNLEDTNCKACFSNSNLIFEGHSRSAVLFGTLQAACTTLLRAHTSPCTAALDMAPSLLFISFPAETSKLHDKMSSRNQTTKYTWRKSP